MAGPRPGSAELRQGRKVRPEEAQEPSWGTAKEALLTMLVHILEPERRVVAAADNEGVAMGERPLKVQGDMHMGHQ